MSFEPDDRDHPGLRGAPHDGLFRHVFGQPRHTAAALRTWLPAAVVAGLDLGTLRRLDPVTGSVRLRERRADLVFEARWRERPALVQVVLEHQSTVDPDMALRLYGLAGELWSDGRRRHPQGPLPAILPCVLAHGRHRWTAARSLQGLIGLGEGPMDRALRREVPELTYRLDDLQAVSEADLRARPWPALPKLTALLFKRARPQANLARTVARWADLVRALLIEGRAAWPAVIRYILTATVTPPDELADHLGGVLPGEVEETIMSTAKNLWAQGMEEGIERGQRRALLQLLQLRFNGPLSAEVLARIEAADAVALGRWTDRVLYAASPEAVVAD